MIDEHEFERRDRLGGRPPPEVEHALFEALGLTAEPSPTKPLPPGVVYSTDPAYCPKENTP